ncbi:hypothetical protein LVD15_21350 [Fulvivirga maritima]|uniref:hypothetical protein n=1 Tax=Fulvivirga maritima TaxID=2904247 RepID=UPI001F2D0F15|nr:hypothetical protein [Fulvivirga maritima]UII25823.1 hypothetical protein LVD15_21350 [Fulvivirga maritima]
MKKLKILFFVLLLIELNVPTYAQKGFGVILKAGQKYEDGQYKKALKLLAKAERMDYGFCGNAWEGSERAINLLRTKIYINQENYQLARKCLNSIGLEYKGDNLDSIRIRTYQMEYGKDSLSNMIDLSFNNTKVVCRENDFFVIIPLTNGEKIELKINPIFNFDLIHMDDENEKVAKWIGSFKESENYKLIQERDLHRSSVKPHDDNY